MFVCIGCGFVQLAMADTHSSSDTSGLIDHAHRLLSFAVGNELSPSVTLRSF